VGATTGYCALGLLLPVRSSSFCWFVYCRLVIWSFACSSRDQSFGSLTKSATSSCFPLRFLSARRITPVASLVYFVLFSFLLSTVLTQLDLPPRTDFARCLRSVGLGVHRSEPRGPCLLQVRIQGSVLQAHPPLLRFL
jgi:hypothetical protein